ncbi:hypothetical protein [Leptospira mayottensis]|uniref:hypothetical protein n=1 Tax=Leptospira mayottensis TaxID=1137606 RepID=UPI0013C302B5|nr:hypothetical protein [Leptospira mayottensis]
MGKNKFYFLKPENTFLKFRTPLFDFCVFLLSFDSLNAEKHATLRPDLDPTFFLVQRNTNLSLGGLFETRKKFPPSYGVWMELPFWKRDRRHFWKTFFLYENHKVLSEEISVVHRTQISLRYSFLSEENFIFPSVFVGWEKGQKDLAVFGIHLEIPERQSIHFFGKIGENFRNVSFFLHSPFDKDLRLFLGVSRTWNDSRTEDQFTLGIGISWEKLSFSFFGNRIGEEETSLTGKFGVSNNLEFADNFDSKNSKLASWKNRIESKNILDPIVTSEQIILKDTVQDQNSISPIRRYTTFFISIQELLSTGFPLSSALKISQKGSRSKKEFFQFLNSLPEKERAKVFVLLKKKNPILRKK